MVVFLLCQYQDQCDDCVIVELCKVNHTHRARNWDRTDKYIYKTVGTEFGYVFVLKVI